MAEKITLECPFCGKLVIDCMYFPPVLQSATSRTSAKSITKFYQTKEKYEIQSGCSNCGKSQKEVEKALKEGKKDPKKDERILKRLKEQGILKDEITTKF